MAGYQGMKPMLQFTNLPPPPRERRRRRRKPVKTPEVPRVKSIPLAQGAGGETGDQENLPRPCLKWVSPQFLDELTENGTHLKNHNSRRRKTNRTKQPLQEMKELFPNESDTDSLQCPKSSARRNPLNFKQNTDQCLEPGTVGRTNRLRSNRAGWSSQEISMYPSTSVPHSKLHVRNYEDESSDNSLTDGENDQHLQNVRCNDGLDDRGCPSLSANQYLQLDAVAHLDGADDHRVPSASQQDSTKDDNFEEIQLKLSTVMQYTETTHRQGEDTCEQTELIPNQNSHSNSHTMGSHVPQSIRQQDELSIYPKVLAGTATVAEDMCNNGGHVSYPSVENLSELIKDMSMGDDMAGNDHSLPVDDQNSSNCEHTCNVHLKHYKCIDRPNCTYTSTSASHDHKLNKLEVTIFSPHLASTPFRDQHAQSVNHTFNSVCHEVLTTARVEVTPGHLEEQDMSILVRETPEHLWCSPHLPNVENHRAECDSKQSFRVSESIFQPGGLKPSYDSNQVEPRCQHTSCRLSDIDMTRLNNFDNTDTSHTTLGDSHSSCTTEDMLGCLHSSIPPTQDESTHGSVEWSILAKQTPDELWTSPVIRVVNDSLNCPCLD